MLRSTVSILMLSVAGGLACGGDSPATEQTPSVPAASAAATPSAAPQDDAALAAAGEQLFTGRACNACHTIGGGRLVGPDLAGVTERREYGWIVAMIVNPDSMVRADPTARQLFAEYMTPMANQGLTRDDAAALYQYFRRTDTQ